MNDKNTQEFSHPRLISVFDIVNPVMSYKYFYLSILDTLWVSNIIDFGCGTWLLTHEFISPERIITGIDPFSELIEKAKERDVGHNIRWLVDSDFDTIPDTSVDIVLLSGHVAQFLIEEKIWKDFLYGASRILKKW